jgi:hypothetical protein
MSWKLDDDEYEAVLHQTAEKQYRYFVNRCADWGEVWGLAVDGSDWAMMDDESGEASLFAVWPHRRYAEACRQREWEHREPTAMDVHTFLDDLIPRLIADGVDMAVFPLPDRRHVPMKPRQLRSDLEAELSRVE